MAVSSNNVESAPRKSALRRIVKRTCLAVLAIVVLGFLALLWPGWPLHPLAALASSRARSEGLDVQIQSPWLRIHTDGTLRLHVSKIRIGDAANPEAVALDDLNLQWRLGDLAGGRFSPGAIHLDEAAATLRTDERGHVQLIALPASSSPSSPAFTPADLPAKFLPASDRPLAITLARTRLNLPAGLPSREVTTGPVTLTVSQPEPGNLDLAGSLDLKIDQRPGSLRFDGRLALVRDWLGRFQLNATAAPDTASPSTRIAFTATRTDAKQPATLSLHLNDCAPGPWLALLGRTDLPAIEGRIDAEFEARGDPFTQHLDSAAAHIKTTALTVSQPSLLTRPLTLSPVEISLTTTDNGAQGRLAAFSTRAGPLAFGSSGVTWQTQGGTISGGGQFHLAAVPLTELLDWLPADLRSRLPLTPAETAEIGLAATTIDLHVAGERTAGLPRLSFSTRGGLALNRELVAIESILSLDAATKEAAVKLTLPDFVQARWQLAVLRRFTLPDLDAPLRAELSLRGRWPDTLDEARWSIVAGEGHVIPQGPSLRWLARPFPVTSFTLTGRLHENQKNLAIDQLELVSGRARFALERTELHSTHALTTATSTGSSDARFALTLERWYASDFLPLLGIELQTVVAPVAEDLAQIGLERLATAAELSFARLPWLDPTLNTLTGTQTAVVRVGEELIPVDAVWKFDAASRRVSAVLQLKDIRPDRIKLSALKNTPVPASALDLAFAARLEVSADPYAQSLDQMKLKADVRITAADGRIKANPLLAADLPVKHLELAASTRILPLRLEKLKVSADFAGPVLLIEDANLDFGETGRSGLQLTLREVPLDWALARVPKEWIPPDFKDAKLCGRLAQLALRAEFRTPTAANPQPKPTALTLSSDVHDFGLLLPNLPEVAIPRLALSGDLDRLTLLIARASTDGLVLSDLKASVSTPLAADPQAAASGTIAADLARLPALLAAARDWVTVPPDLNLTGLAGQATVGFTASAPLDPEKLPAALRAKADIAVRDLIAPPALVPAGLVVGPSSLALTADITGENAAGTVNWKPKSLVFAPWLKGAPVLDATYALTPQTLDVRPRLDLAGTVIDVPELCWHKSVGLPAVLSADARYTLRTPAAPARLAATVSAEGLVTSPVRTRVEADLSDDQRPSLNLADGLARVQLRDTVIGLTTLELDATRAPDGATQLDLRIPVLDLSAWIKQLEPALTAWNRLPPPPPPAKNAPAKPPVAPAPAGPPIPVLDLPALNLNATIDRITLSPSQNLGAVTLDTALRNGLPARLAFAATAGAGTTLKARLDPAATGRQPWSFTLTDFGGWLRTGAAPLALLPASPDLPDSTFETLRTLPATFKGGDITLKGTADLRDAQATFDGNAQIERLTLEQELAFLAKIAALVKKRVILQVPFKVFDIPSFTASPTKVSIRKMRIDGPLNVASDRLNLDFTTNEIDMGGKVLGIGFEVAGPIDDPRFYLSEKNVIVKGLTTQDDFDW